MFEAKRGFLSWRFEPFRCLKWFISQKDSQRVQNGNMLSNGPCDVLGFWVIVLCVSRSFKKPTLDALIVALCVGVLKPQTSWEFALSLSAAFIQSNKILEVLHFGDGAFLQVSLTNIHFYFEDFFFALKCVEWIFAHFYKCLFFFLKHKPVT